MTVRFQDEDFEVSQSMFKLHVLIKGKNVGLFAQVVMQVMAGTLYFLNVPQYLV